jgi:hypothetical protein
LLVVAAALIVLAQFRYVLYDYAITLAGLLGLAAALGARGRPGAGWVVAGVAASALGALVQLGRIGQGRTFNHNDLFHVVQAIGHRALRAGRAAIWGARRPCDTVGTVRSAIVSLVLASVVLAAIFACPCPAMAADRHGCCADESASIGPSDCCRASSSPAPWTPRVAPAAPCLHSSASPSGARRSALSVPDDLRRVLSLVAAAHPPHLIPGVPLHP